MHKDNKHCISFD